MSAYPSTSLAGLTKALLTTVLPPTSQSRLRVCEVLSQVSGKSVDNHVVQLSTIMGLSVGQLIVDYNNAAICRATNGGTGSPLSAPMSRFVRMVGRTVGLMERDLVSEYASEGIFEDAPAKNSVEHPAEGILRILKSYSTSQLIKSAFKVTAQLTESADRTGLVGTGSQEAIIPFALLFPILWISKESVASVTPVDGDIASLSINATIMYNVLEDLFGGGTPLPLIPLSSSPVPGSDPSVYNHAPLTHAKLLDQFFRDAARQAFSDLGTFLVGLDGSKMEAESKKQLQTPIKGTITKLTEQETDAWMTWLDEVSDVQGQK